jgi:hypothetical protein
MVRDYRYYKNNTQQYVTEYEGTEQDEEYDSDLDKESTCKTVQILIVDTSPPLSLPQEQTELFLTSFGSILLGTATKITNNLVDRLFVHAVTGTSTSSAAIPENPLLTLQHATGLTISKDPPAAPETVTDLTTSKTPETDSHTYLNAARYTADRFYGVVIDTGASQRSIAGYGQVVAYQKSHPVTIDTTRAGMVKVQFGIGTASSIGSVTVQTPIGTVEFHVVQADTPFLLCLADMDALGVYYNNLKNALVTLKGSIPVVRRFGHPFLLWNEPLESFITDSLDHNPCFLTATELRRLHRRFGHPAADRLHRVLERAGHDDIHRNTIDYITKYCDHCQRHGKSPGRFKFTLRTDQDPVFNYSIFVDIIYIDGDPVLHVVDEATRFQAARWLRNLSAKHTWEVLRYCWMDTYTGPPDYIFHDAGKNFASREFRQYAASMATITKSVPVEAHWSIGIVERAHPLLRRAYKIMTEEFKGDSISKDFLLQMAVKAVNDTAGPDGLIPTLLVFGAYP